MCVVDTGSLNVTLCPVVYRMGMVWPVGGAARIQWLVWIAVEILCVLSSFAKNALMLVLSVSVNTCLVLRRAWCRWVFWAYRLVVLVGGDGQGMVCGGIE